MAQELSNVTHTIFVVTSIHTDCIQTKFSALRSTLVKLEHQKCKVRKRKNSSAFHVECLSISRLLGLGGSKL